VHVDDWKSVKVKKSDFLKISSPRAKNSRRRILHWEFFLGSRQRINSPRVFVFAENFFYSRWRVLRREPEGRLSPKIFALGEGPVSRSACGQCRGGKEPGSLPRAYWIILFPFSSRIHLVVIGLGFSLLCILSTWNMFILNACASLCVPVTAIRCLRLRIVKKIGKILFKFNPWI
jgi:hypothetical protein